MNTLQRLSLAQKFIILGALALLMSALPSWIFLKQTAAEIDTARLEARGTAPVIALIQVLQLTQQHRGLAAGMLGGDEALAAKLPEKREAVATAIAALDARLTAAGTSAAIVSQWAERKKHWGALEQAVASRQLKPAESTARHTRLIAEYLALNEDLLDEFGLSLDPLADSYALIMASFSNAPALTERLGQMRAQGTGFLATASLTPEGRVTLSAIQSRANELFGDMLRNLGKANAANASLKMDLSDKGEQLKAQINQTFAMADKRLIHATELNFPANEYNQNFTNTINAVFEFNAVSARNLSKLLHAREQGLRQSRFLTMTMLLSLLSACAALAWFFVRSITLPLRDAVQVARYVAEGDLSCDVPQHGNSEVGQLMQSLRLMKDNLARVVGSVRQGSEGLATASNEIAQGNQDLSGRTERQAGALQETAAAMQELNSTVMKNADSARLANQLALAASGVATRGGAVVDQVVQTMKGIDDASRKISSIISVIEGIAFQTNILALNAAVEAARAGEQGRGFAVVASEVRSLAGRSAQAAKEVKALINDSVDRVGRGNTLVSTAGGTMTEVVGAIQRVTDIMGQISTASAEQSAGVAQIEAAVCQMDHATQQNAAMVEQMAASAAGLKSQAKDLVQLVAVFKIEPHRPMRLVPNVDQPVVQHSPRFDPHVPELIRA